MRRLPKDSRGRYDDRAHPLPLRTRKRPIILKNGAQIWHYSWHDGCLVPNPMTLSEAEAWRDENEPRTITEGDTA